MARIVLGIGTSHSPLISTPPELWSEHARFDRELLPLLGKDGQYHPYAELLAQAGDTFAEQVALEVFQAKHERCQTALATLADAFAAAEPDVAIIVGDDQQEQFSDENMPAMCVYWGDTILNAPRVIPEGVPPSIVASAWAFGTQERLFPVAADFGKHVITSLIDDEFDIAHAKKLGKRHGVGHAFSFVYNRIMGGHVPPHVPILLNTYYPPNQPTPKRCYALGQAIRRAVEAWPQDVRVAVIGSGGLTHFVIDEALDQRVLDAMAAHDGETLCALPRSLMNSGNSEILNWVTAAGVLSDLQMALLDYVPCYRTPAGTGIAAAFALWS